MENTNTSQIPRTQTAVQLIGPDRLTLNTQKPVHTPGPYQILCRIEAVGLCFSDLKLLKQFSDHARKSKIISGIDPGILKEIPSYVPDELPAVPGHEAVIRVCAIGEKVKNINLNDRCLVQTDYRWLPTQNSNASFGYNFEGALQQYVLMDQRVITSPDGRSLLIPASEDLSASAIALVEPWACVEDSYAAKQRNKIKIDGQTLIVTDNQIEQHPLDDFFNNFGKPAGTTNTSPQKIDTLEDAAFDDVLYFGSNPQAAEKLFTKVAANGLFNIILRGRKFPADVITTIGRVHYGNIRIIGTATADPADAMRNIPPTGHLKDDLKINTVGAAGPMGLMHVVRNICLGLKNLTIYAGDLDHERLAALNAIAQPLAEKHNVDYHPYNPSVDAPHIDFDYTILMVPVPNLVANAVKHSAQNAIINIFAGIPASVTAPLDLNTYIEKHLYFIGTSGSVLEDMETVLAKVQSGSLDTNISLAAVSGLAGAVDGMRAVENHSIPGKIIVYPACPTLPLITLDELKQTLPKVAEKLNNGLWTKQAEEQLLTSH
jgi:threonine dehydrogenase-like Zn-dependent dehydrogenase